MSNRKRVSRRTFLGVAGKAAVGAAALSFAGSFRARGGVGPNDRVRLAIVGCGGMGSRHVEALAVNPRCEIAAVCDVYKPRYFNAAKTVEELGGYKPEGVQDFRTLLDRPDIDAILTATPDHWHPLITILGCQAGKDVYVEKPACTTVEEGRAMVTAARRYGRVVQVGTQQRSMPLFQQAIEVVRRGTFGPITSAGAWVGVNGIGVGENPREVPENLDWDLWLGPAPKVPFSPERFMGFRSFHDYARGGELANWGIHLMDIVQWGIREDWPLAVQATGGSYRGGAGADNYETIDAVLEYKGCTVTWEQRHSNTYAGKGYGIRFQGPQGRLLLDRGTFVVDPPTLGIEEVVGAPELTWANTDHHNNFFDCIVSRAKPAADVEQGVRSTTTVLLAGIALKTRRKLTWDGSIERFVGDEQANQHLSRPYRAPWRLS